MPPETVPPETSQPDAAQADAPTAPAPTPPLPQQTSPTQLLLPAWWPLSWWATFAALSGLHLLFLAVENGPLASITKLAPAAWLVAYVVVTGGPRLLAIALAFCLGGDLFLEFDSLFTLGMVSFAAAHVCFVRCFAARGALERLRDQRRTIAALVVLALGLLALVIPGVDDRLIQVALPLYAALLVATAVTSRAVDPVAGLGGLAFLVSDAIIALGVGDRLDTDAFWPRIAIMVLYFAALAALTHGALRHDAGRSGETTYRGIVGTLGALFRLQGYRFDLRGAEHLPAEGPAVIAGNHIGFLDFTFIGYAARDRGRFVRFMSKTSVFEIPVVGRWMRAMGHVPVDRRAGAVAYRQAGRLLERGDLVGVFPEATISRSWVLKDFKPGAVGLALAHGVPIVPVIVWGGHRIYTVDGHRTLRRGIPVSIHVGEPLVPEADDTLESLTARLRDAMQALLDTAIDDYPEQPRDEADRWWLPHSRGGAAPDPVTADRLDREALARIGEDFD